MLEAGGRGRAAGAVLESSVRGIGPSEKKIVISFLINADFHCTPSIKKDLLR